MDLQQRSGEGRSNKEEEEPQKPPYATKTPENAPDSAEGLLD